MTENQIFSRILVPVDGSLSALVAEDLAVLIAKKLNSKITALHVVSHEFMEPHLQKLSPESERYVYATTVTGDATTPLAKRIPNIPTIELPAEDVREITNSFREEGKEVLADAVADFREDGMSVDQKLIENSSPPEAIVRQAQEMKCDLIVMGRSAGEENKKPHLGSVAAKVSGRSPISVLIAGKGNVLSKMLVPVDGSEISMKAADCAAILSGKTGASVTLLHVLESGLFKRKPEVAKKLGANLLSTIAGSMKDVKVDQKMEQGDPAETITQMAEKGDYDIIVMGGAGHSMIGHFLMGRVSDHVLHYTDRSVLLVK
jgi:nucleotide-binding universal stress UspA family protein